MRQRPERALKETTRWTSGEDGTRVEALRDFHTQVRRGGGSDAQDEAPHDFRVRVGRCIWSNDRHLARFGVRGIRRRDQLILVSEDLERVSRRCCFPNLNSLLVGSIKDPLKPLEVTHTL